RALNELIASPRNLRRRGDHKAAAQNINRHIAARTDQSPLACMAIPGLEMPAPTARDNSRSAMSLERIGQHPRVCRIDIEHRHAAALAAHETNRRRMTKLAGNLGAVE